METSSIVHVIISLLGNLGTFYEWTAKEETIYNGTNSVFIKKMNLFAQQSNNRPKKKKKKVMVCTETWELVKDHVAVAITQRVSAAGAVLGLELGKETDKTEP